MPAPDPALVPELTDGEVRLRAHREDDLPGIVDLARDERSLRWTTNIPTPYAEADAYAFLDMIRAGHEAGTRRFWAIEADGEFAGTVNYSHRGAGLAELGYGLRPGTRGRGVATRAARLAVAYALDHDAVEVLQWRAALGNLASRRVAWANGFRIDGVWPDAHVSSTGEHRDDLLIGHLNRGDQREPAHPWWEPAVLEGNGIRLRPWRSTDCPTDPPDELTARYVVSPGMVPSPDTFATWLLDRQSRMAAGEGVYWCIADAATDEAVGGIQVDQLDSPVTRGTGSVGYWLSPTARGRGLLAVALESVVGHAFRQRTDVAGRTGLGLHRLWAGTDIRNRASQRTLRRAGFREVLTEQKVLTRPGQDPTDAISFELLASDDRDAQRVEPAPATVLTTERLRLRPWRESDRPRPDQGPDEEALRQMPPRAVPTPATWDTWLSRRERLRDTGVHDFCIADVTTDEALGDISIFDLDRAVNHGEIGYWLYPAARGNGYLDEALAAVVEHAFRPESEGGAGLNRLRGETNLANYASRAILLRAGFRHWGEDHQAYVLGAGEPVDGAYYELLRAWHDRPSPAVEVPVIEGEHVRLRPWRMSDADRIVGACSDPTTRHWLPGLPDPYDRDAARAYVHTTREWSAAGTQVAWCVADRETDVPIACLGLGDLRGPRPATASVGYWAHPDARGRGVVTEALSLAITHAFASTPDGGLDRRRLTLLAAEGNHGSIGVAEHTGFRRIGIEHDAERLGDGSRVAMHRFELLREVPAGLPPRLTATDVVLRPMELADAERIAATWADSDTRHWIEDVPEPTARPTRAWVRRHRVVDLTGHGVCFTICRPNSPQVCGNLRLQRVSPPGPAAGAEIGYWLHPGARGQGLAAAALRAASTYAFTAPEEGGLGLARLTLGIADGNAASVAVARAAGFEQVGRERRAEVLGDGSVVDLLRFDRLAD